MPTITITLDDTGDALRLVWDVAHLQSAAAATIHFDGRTNGDHVEADPTPPHGTPRPKPVKRPLLVSVPCPTCGAAAGDRCRTDRGGLYTGYDFGHSARKQARDAAWKQTQA